MRIGVLQFNAKLGSVESNVTTITNLLRQKCKKPLDLLVLPELALTGYAFKSREHIKPFLEDSRGQSFRFAQGLCKSVPSRTVIIGFPELGSDGQAYNSGLVVHEETLLYQFRKKHLYVTDETWAAEGQSFGAYQLPASHTLSSKPLSMALGICMDLNPKQFKAPFDAFEFGKHCLSQDADLIVIPMAWTKSEVPASDEDDLYIARYWLTRLGPVLQREKRTLVVFANRTGHEEGVVYQGHSCIVAIYRGECTILGRLGYEEDLLVVSTDVMDLEID